MLVSLVGNLNNNFSALARHLLDNGIDIRLYRYTNEPNHFAPEADMFSDLLAGKTEEIPFASTCDIFDAKIIAQYKKIGERSDLILACGYAPAFFAAANIKVDVLIPYGSDIYDLPFYKFTFHPKFAVANLVFSLNQKRGIKNANLLLMEKQSADTEMKVKKIRKDARREQLAIPMIHDRTYQNLDYDSVDSSLYTAMKTLRAQYELLIFHHSRHSWYNPVDSNEQKGNNLLFLALAEFKENFPGVRIGIVTVEYGVDVERSRQLTKELNIDHCVHWFPKQKRRDLMLGISLSDIVVAELTGGYNLYGTVVEGLVMGKPVIQSRTKEKFKDTYIGGAHYALVVEDYPNVCSLLTYYWTNREDCNKSAGNGPIWYRENIVSPFMDQINRYLNNKR